MSTPTMSSPSTGHQAAALWWAAGVACLGATALAALSALWWAVATTFVTVADAVYPELEPAPDSTGFLVVTIAAMAVCVAAAVGAAWIVVRTPGLAPSGALVGALCGVLGSFAGLAVWCLALGIDPSSVVG